MVGCKHEWTVLFICSVIHTGRHEIRVCRRCGLDRSTQVPDRAALTTEADR